jgi:hypothetical protein
MPDALTWESAPRNVCAESGWFMQQGMLVDASAKARRGVSRFGAVIQALVILRNQLSNGAACLALNDPVLSQS